MRVVIDTNVLVSALMTDGGAARAVVRACLTGGHQPLIGAALFAEYEDVFARDALFARTGVDAGERRVVLDAFLSVCVWIRISYLWRPNLPDPGDDHLVELAIAGGAQALVTGNIRDFRGELRLPFQVLAPHELTVGKV